MVPFLFAIVVFVDLSTLYVVGAYRILSGVERMRIFGQHRGFLGLRPIEEVR
jgi:hypothetical protein